MVVVDSDDKNAAVTRRTFNPLMPTAAVMGTAIMHPVPDVCLHSECQSARRSKNYQRRLN